MLERILPRAIDPASGTESVSLMTSIIGAVHLDRTLARTLGWRGVKPSFAGGAAWTFRVAGSDAVHGLEFIDEESGDGLVTGRFRLYEVPAEQVKDEGRREALRELSLKSGELAGFRSGTLEINFSADGAGLLLSTECPWAGHTGTMRVFALFAATVRAVLEAPAELILNAERSESGELILAPSAAYGTFTGQMPGRRMTALHFVHRPRSEELESLPVVHVVTGFLGSGKTTFLREWLEYLHGRERFTGVIQNEFGEADLDSLILSGQTRVESLDDGCVCCSLADTLRPGIERLIAATPAEQFILETTGVASPSFVMDSLWTLGDLVRRGLLIAVADGYDLTQNPSRLDETDCIRDQVASADVIIVSKADAVEDEALERLSARLKLLNDEALIIEADHGRIPFAVLDKFYEHWLDTRGYELPSRSGRAVKLRPAPAGRGPIHFGAPAVSDEASGRFTTRTVEFDGPMTTDRIRDLVREAGPALRRAKGVADIEGEGRMLIQCASGVLAIEPVPADAAEAGFSDGRSFLVLISERPGTQPETPA
ncbi:GTP-binding protein [Sutterella sp.]|uniref:CobW family GTP-binding protein n=1 Tax=Sutterella sp. TaxID=1981025 RepID=UPI0026E06DF6|nr:GTP-binding protein [Sutterella sp.]MDO5532626.1 GTP-binding protein [Sutterella sp.]